MYLLSSQVTLSGGFICRNNLANHEGGCIFASTGSIITGSSLTFSNNQAYVSDRRSKRGGAVFLDNSKFICNGCSFTSNRAVGTQALNVAVTTLVGQCTGGEQASFVSH
jgi:hypothetical protein